MLDRIIYPSIYKKNTKICAILYNLKMADRIEAGFSIRGLKELRISLTDTTHEAITLSEVFDFPCIFSMFFTYTNKAVYFYDNIEKKLF